MKTITVTFIVAATILCTLPTYSKAEGLPVSKYLEDPEHKNEIFGFYLNALFSGINLANERAKPHLFCFEQGNAESPYEMIDRRIAKLKREKRLNNDATVDEIIMDILIKEHPCN